MNARTCCSRYYRLNNQQKIEDGSMGVDQIFLFMSMSTITLGKRSDGWYCHKFLGEMEDFSMASWLKDLSLTTTSAWEKIFLVWTVHVVLLIRVIRFEQLDCNLVRLHRLLLQLLRSCHKQRAAAETNALLLTSLLWRATMTSFKLPNHPYQKLLLSQRTLTLVLCLFFIRSCCSKWVDIRPSFLLFVRATEFDRYRSCNTSRNACIVIALA